MNSWPCWKWGSLLAHPGHGTIPADDPAHYLFEPIHAFWGLLAIGLILSVVLSLRARHRLRLSSSGERTLPAHQKTDAEKKLK